MNRIAHNTSKNESAEAIIEKFTKENCVSDLLCSVCKTKVKGISNISILRFLMGVIFTGRSMNQNLEASRNPGFAKDTVYRFLSSCSGWFKSLPKIAASLVDKFFKPLTDESRDNVLIIDDSAFSRERSKKVELLARTFDHARNKFSKGFRLLTVGWSDGNSFVPVDYSLLSAGKDSNLIQESRSSDNLSEEQISARQTSRLKSTQVVLDMLDEVKKTSLDAKYVLFDSWFCLPTEVISVKNRGYDVIGMVKKSSKIHFEVDGCSMSVKDIYRKNKKKRGLAHIRLVVDAVARSSEKESSIPVRLVFISQNSNRKNWLVLLSTDTSIDAEKICTLYGRRWETECFYKVCKSMLNLERGCQCRNYDSIMTHTAIVMLQYMMLSQQKRTCEDDRTLGDLFFAVVDQMEEMSFTEALKLIIQALFDEIVKVEGMSEAVRVQIVQIFINKLPQTLTASLKLSA